MVASEEAFPAEANIQQDEAVTLLSHSKMMRRLRQMSKNNVARSDAEQTSTIDGILQKISSVKKQHQAVLGEMKVSRERRDEIIARRARIANTKPYPHLKPWSECPLLDPDRTRVIPDAIAGDPRLEFQEIKRIRKESAAEHPSWKYPNVDRAFGEPPLYSCTDTYKKVLEAHLVQAVTRISKSYEGMSEGTLQLSNLKADVGAELWLMQSALDEVRKGLRDAREKERLKLLARGRRRRSVVQHSPTAAQRTALARAPLAGVADTQVP